MILQFSVISIEDIRFFIRKWTYILKTKKKLNFCIELKKKLKGSGLDKTKNLTVENRPGIGMQMCMENLKKKGFLTSLKVVAL